MVRPQGHAPPGPCTHGGRYELIAGERQFRAVRGYTGIKAIAARVVKANDLEARRISAAENLQREDLSAIETIEGTVEMVDAELIEDREYASMGKKPANRVKELLGKLDSMRRNKVRGYRANEEIRHTSHKFMGRVEKIFNNLPKSLEWRSFYNNDLPVLMDISEEVQKASTQHQLNKSQTKALETLKTASVEEFQRVKACCQGSPNSVIEPDTRDSSQLDIKDLSAREIEGIVEKLGVVRQTVNNWISDIRTQQRASREAKILRLSRLACPPSLWRGWTQEQISKVEGLSRNRISEIVGNIKFDKIDNLLSEGRNMDYIAKHYHMDVALTWALR